MSLDQRIHPEAVTGTRPEGWPAPPPNPLCSVVICTVGRNPGLSRALTSVLQQREVEFELIVVDNAPGTGNTASVAERFDDHRLRYVTEPCRGLSAARNRGVQSARGDVVVFTDDDCVVNPTWLSSIRGVFDTYPEVSCVTGRTIPDGQQNRVQELFEEFGSFNRGTMRRVWHYRAPLAQTLSDDLVAADSSAEQSPIYPYTAVFGSGNNMAFTAAALRQLGPFDEALGAGSPSGGGEDLDMFIRLILRGLVLVYEPAALVRHTHRVDSRSLATQIRHYGSGLSAMITKHVLLDHPSRIRVARRAVPGLRHLLSSASAKNARKSRSFPRYLTALELLGVIVGPWLYLQGRLAVSWQRRVSSR